MGSEYDDDDEEGCPDCGCDPCECDEEDDTEEQETETLQVASTQTQPESAEQSMPTLPAILWYKSKTHKCRRYYVRFDVTGETAPRKIVWSEKQSEACVFASMDHLILAGTQCRNRGYHEIQVKEIKS